MGSYRIRGLYDRCGQKDELPTDAAGKHFIDGAVHDSGDGHAREYGYTHSQESGDREPRAAPTIANEPPEGFQGEFLCERPGSETS